MSSPFPPSPIAGFFLARAGPARLVLALGFCAWVVATCSGGSPHPTVAAVARMPDARKVAARIGFTSAASPVTDQAPVRRSLSDVRYTVTGIATGFGALPGFVILQADDGSTPEPEPRPDPARRPQAGPPAT